MPSVQLYQSELDEVELIRTALAEGCCIVPCYDYESPEEKRLSTLEDFLGARTKVRQFFFTSESFERAPLSMREISKGGKAIFYIQQNTGGPFLQFLGGGLFLDEATGEDRIRPGLLSFSRHYRAEDLSWQHASPPELEEMFKQFLRVIKKNSVRIKPGKSVFWLGKDAEVQVRRGAKLIGYENWSLASRGYD